MNNEVISNYHEILWQAAGIHLDLCIGLIPSAVLPPANTKRWGRCVDRQQLPMSPLVWAYGVLLWPILPWAWTLPGLVWATEHCAFPRCQRHWCVQTAWPQLVGCTTLVLCLLRCRKGTSIKVESSYLSNEHRESTECGQQAIMPYRWLKATKTIAVKHTRGLLP